ncbi:MAG: aminotransferase class I/II-fold pyridoxal phosphate-dependent enzyme, partial [Leptolyngbyaceae cyanobacterium SM1_3_5]|nr:aminotransferase class I/II-fold pyridoxal phosphate-dependent enzyme [Leptolyngbyaceae cyanobacterium SM1_3_5]
DYHFARTKLVCLENTHNRSGGRIFPLSEIEAIAQLCQSRNLKLHLDGARLWNACAATGISEAQYAKPFDTVSVCFSKGLGAPVGSALVGSQELIDRSRRFRKMWGGGMRQAGMIVAGALYALKHHRDRLQEDHANAKLFAQSIAQIEEVDVDIEAVETNIVIFHTKVSAQSIAQRLTEKGVAMLAIAPNSLRAVTNLMVDRAQVEQAAKLVEESIAEASI